MDERIIKYFTNSLNQLERIQLLKELQVNSDLKEQMIRYQHIEGLFNLHPEMKNEEIGKIKLDIFKKIINDRQKKRIIVTFSKYAALVAFLIICTWSITYYTTQKTILAFQQELKVPVGQRAELTLPDGTKVWLNSDSKISFPSTFTKERRVTLTGEAYFEVAKNKELPFIVSTSLVDIKALGTKFNVYSYPKSKDMNVFLLEGAVKVYNPKHCSQEVILSPNQRLTQKGGEYIIENVTNDNSLLWKEGIYSFDKQKLSTIITKLELYFDVQIIVKNPIIMSYEYTGKFRQKDGVMEILRIIQKIHNFKITKNEKSNQVILSL